MSSLLELMRHVADTVALSAALRCYGKTGRPESSLRMLVQHFSFSRKKSTSEVSVTCFRLQVGTKTQLIPCRADELFLDSPEPIGSGTRCRRRWEMACRIWSQVGISGLQLDKVWPLRAGGSRIALDTRGLPSIERIVAS